MTTDTVRLDFYGEMQEALRQFRGELSDRITQEVVRMKIRQQLLARASRGQSCELFPGAEITDCKVLMLGTRMNVLWLADRRTRRYDGALNEKRRYVGHLGSYDVYVELVGPTRVPDWSVNVEQEKFSFQLMVVGPDGPTSVPEDEEFQRELSFRVRALNLIRDEVTQ